MKRQITPYIHCSKLNSVLQIIQQIPVLLTKEQNVQSQHKFTNIQNNAFSSIISILDSFEDLFRSCSKDNCVHFLLNVPLSAPLTEISSLRSAAVDSFKQLNQTAISDLFKVSEKDINQQDEVDMKRIAQILIQISNSKREDLSSQITQRFESLKKKGIECSPDVNCDVTIPNLPKNMNFVIKHSDVELGKQIGKGQSGTVSVGKYKGNEVAVKILYRRALSQPELESFRREILVLSLLDFPSLIKFYGYTEEPPFYILTDYMSNGSLFDFLRKSPDKLTPTHRTLIALDVARGLEYLHSRNIIHRDMKSLNVLLDSNLRAKICDFGMVRVKQNAPMTGLIGTPHWMAPEVFMSIPTYNEKVDVFSYGILLWELLTSDMPYNGMKQVDITIGVTNGTLRPPFPPGPQTSLMHLIERCWAQDPNDRPTMKQVVKDIENNPKCHFTDTNESVFRSLASKPKHRSTSSQVVTHHKKKRNGKRLSEPSKLLPEDDIDNVDGELTDNDLSVLQVASLISQLDSSSGKEHQKFLEKLCEYLGDDKKTTDEIAKSKNGCLYIIECISNNDLTELCLKNLKKCKSESIFDVDVLKVLLQFSNNEDQKMRELSLSVLVEASKLRFDFLISAPNFLLQLLNFLKKPISSNLAYSILHISKKLLALFSLIPEGIIPILISTNKNSDQPNVQKVSLKCINIVLKFDSVRNEINDEMWNDLLSEPYKDSAIDAFCEGSNRSSSDLIFLRKFITILSPKLIELHLPSILKNTRFSSILLDVLPLKESGSSKKKESTTNSSEPSSEQDKPNVSNKHVSVVYKTIIKNCPWLMTKIVNEIHEFYQISAYMIKHNKIEFICNELKKYFQSNYINMKLLLKSKICDALFDYFLMATKVEELLPLMAVIYNIMTVIADQVKSSELLTFISSNSKAETNLFLLMNSPLILHKSYVLLFCEQEVFRMPSFLVISSIAMAKQAYPKENISTKSQRSFFEGIEFDKLLCAAAFYVNSEVSLLREVGNKIIQMFINNQKLNLTQIAKIFVGNFKVSDENTRCSANAIIDSSQKDQLLDDDILQMIYSISEKE